MLFTKGILRTQLVPWKTLRYTAKYNTVSTELSSGIMTSSLAPVANQKITARFSDAQPYMVNLNEFFRDNGWSPNAVKIAPWVSEHGTSGATFQFTIATYQNKNAPADILAKVTCLTGLYRTSTLCDGTQLSTATSQRYCHTFTVTDYNNANIIAENDDDHYQKGYVKVNDLAGAQYLAVILTSSKSNMSKRLGWDMCGF